MGAPNSASGDPLFLAIGPSVHSFFRPFKKAMMPSLPQTLFAVGYSKMHPVGVNLGSPLKQGGSAAAVPVNISPLISSDSCFSTSTEAIAIL